MAGYYDDVYALVKRIPHGKISTYGRIAQLTPVPRGARGVGWALAGLGPENAREVPWWRVINAAGRISNEYNATLQRELLEAEGVQFSDKGYVDLKRFLWDGSGFDTTEPLVVRRAGVADVGGIRQVCIDSWRDTYRDLMRPEMIERMIAEFYNQKRIEQEVREPEGWNGWWVAKQGERVVGAGGGGMLRPGIGELFVLYVDPACRGEGIGTQLLNAITGELLAEGAREQWVSVAKGNMKGIPFYQARGFVQRGEQMAHGSVLADSIIALRMWRAVLPDDGIANS